METLLAGALVLLALASVAVRRAVWIVPQARARNVERLGRFHRTLKPGPNLVVPFVDRVYPLIDLREQVATLRTQPVMTDDDLVVEIDTVLYFQVTDPRAAAYEISDHLVALELIAATILRNIVGSMDLATAVVARDTVNTRLHEELADVTVRWGIRIDQVETEIVDLAGAHREATVKRIPAERDRRSAS